MIGAEAATPEPGAAVAPEKPRIVEWFWRAAALRRARGLRNDLPAAERQALACALVATEQADRCFDPVDPLRAGSSLGLSISLYREAAYWGLLAQSADYAGKTLRELFDTLPTELLERMAGGSDQLGRVRRALVERSFVDTAILPEEMLPAEAQAARDFVHALVRSKLLPERELGRLLLQRTVRSLGLVLVLATVAVCGWLAIAHLRRTPDLAAGKPWRASSSSDKCHPAQHRCAGVHSDMFFTTNEEIDPWLDIDLGKPTKFNTVEVTNRSDCCPDRAIPLLVEVSTDRTKWREVSRRTDTFSVWRAEFAPQSARYVRLRVPRRTILHLEKVAVYDGR
jgi:hypothetical protein